jgi:hypothetical protein
MRQASRRLKGSEEAGLPRRSMTPLPHQFLQTTFCQRLNRRKGNLPEAFSSKKDGQQICRLTLVIDEQDQVDLIAPDQAYSVHQFWNVHKVIRIGTGAPEVHCSSPELALQLGINLVSLEYVTQSRFHDKDTTGEELTSG